MAIKRSTHTCFPQLLPVTSCCPSLRGQKLWRWWLCDAINRLLRSQSPRKHASLKSANWGVILYHCSECPGTEGNLVTVGFALASGTECIWDMYSMSSLCVLSKDPAMLDFLGHCGGCMQAWAWLSEETMMLPLTLKCAYQFTYI